MNMKKAFIGVGIGVMVVTGLIQSGVIDVNDKLGQPTVSTPSQPSTGGLKSLFSTPELTEVVFQLESLDGGILCGLPTGRHTITAEQTPLDITRKEDGMGEVINFITGGGSGQRAENLPYHDENYYWGILFNKKPSGSEVLIKENGCVNVILNIDKKAKVDWYTLTHSVDINITVQ